MTDTPARFWVIREIDTGGTFTDAVLLDEAGAVVASAKALTTKDDLSVGIGQAMALVNTLCVPLAALALWSGMGAFRAAVQLPDSA